MYKAFFRRANGLGLFGLGAFVGAYSRDFLNISRPGGEEGSGVAPQINQNESRYRVLKWLSLGSQHGLQRAVYAKQVAQYNKDVELLKSEGPYTADRLGLVLERNKALKGVGQQYTNDSRLDADFLKTLTTNKVTLTAHEGYLKLAQGISVNESERPEVSTSHCLSSAALADNNGSTNDMGSAELLKFIKAQEGSPTNILKLIRDNPVDFSELKFERLSSSQAIQIGYLCYMQADQGGDLHESDQWLEWGLKCYSAAYYSSSVKPEEKTTLACLIGEVYLLKVKKAAVSSWEGALLDHDMQPASGYNKIGHWVRRDATKAVFWLEQARKTNNNLPYFTPVLRLAQLYLCLENTKEAEQYCDAALEILLGGGPHYGKVPHEYRVDHNEQNPFYAAAMRVLNSLHEYGAVPFASRVEKQYRLACSTEGCGEKTIKITSPTTEESILPCL